MLAVGSFGALWVCSIAAVRGTEIRHKAVLVHSLHPAGARDGAVGYAHFYFPAIEGWHSHSAVVENLGGLLADMLAELTHE